MDAIIVRSDGPIAMVGAGNVEADDLEIVAEYGNRVVAADGGAHALLAADIMPDAVIGDMDSADSRLGGAVPADRIHRIDEQDSTDFDKCLRSVEAPLIVCLGFTGPRLDHTLAVFNALVRHADRPAVVVGARDLVFHAPADLKLDLPPGMRLSLFPMGPVSGRSRGLRWPIDGIDFAPAARIGTSNEVTGPLRLSFDRPGMLVITPREALAAVARALSG